MLELKSKKSIVKRKKIKTKLIQASTSSTKAGFPDEINTELYLWVMEFIKLEEV